MRTDLIWRALLPVGALVALAAGAPQGLTGALALAGLALATERLVRLRATGPADRVLVGLGGVLVVLILAGLVLGSTALGLSPTSWSITLGVLGLAGLGVAAVVPTRTTDAADLPLATAGRLGRGQVLGLVPWVAAAAVVVVLSVQLTGGSLSAATEAPVQMSFGTVSGTQVQVVVSASDAVGPLEIRTAAEGNETSYPLFSVGDDGSVTTTVSLPASGRYVITLNYPDQTTPLRTLILDR